MSLSRPICRRPRRRWPMQVAGPKGTQQLFLRDALGHLSATVTFTEVGAYTLSLNGHLNARPFTLRWVVRAEGK